MARLHAAHMQIAGTDTVKYPSKDVGIPGGFKMKSFIHKTPVRIGVTKKSFGRVGRLKKIRI